MREILQQLHQEISLELARDSAAMESLGSPSHQLKVALEGFLEEIDQNEDYNPFDLTNRVLHELNRHQRLKT